MTMKTNTRAGMDVSNGTGSSTDYKVTSAGGTR